MFESVSLKSTIKHIVCDFNINNSNHVEDDDENINWNDLVMKCIEGRQQKVFSKIPEISISESEQSIIPDDHLFEDQELGRDGNFSANCHQIIMEDIPLITTPRSSMAHQKALPTTLIEEIVSPDSSFSADSPPSVQRSSSSGPSTSLQRSSSCFAPQSPPVHSPDSSFSAHSSPLRSPSSSFIAPSPLHSPAPPKPSKSKMLTKSEPETVLKRNPNRYLKGQRLQTWRGEHPIYVPVENGCWDIVGKTKPYTPDHLKRKRVIRKLKPKQILAPITTTSNTIDEPSVSDTFIEKSDSTKDKLSKIFLNRDALGWKKSKFNENIEHATLIKSKETNQLVGYVRFSSKCIKQPQLTTHLTLFVLMKGSISLKIGEEAPVLVKELDPVIIPEQTFYSMENLVDSESILLFTIL